MQGDHLGPAGGEEVAEAPPHVGALAGLGRRQFAGGQFGAERREPGAVVPEDPVVLGQPVEEAPGPVEVGGVGLVEADDDLVEVGDAGDLVDHGAERRAVHLGGQAGEDEGHRPFAGPAREFVLERLGGPAPQVVEGGDHPVLEEVRHA